MRQERLVLLQQLLAEAREALPEAQHFEVREHSDGLALFGEEVYLDQARWQSWTLQPNGEIIAEEGATYPY